jgi:predicted dehydrogenase
MNERVNLGRRVFLRSSAAAVGGLACAGTAPGAWANARSELRIGVVGLKHYHVYTVLKAALKLPGVKIVALADDDPKNKKDCEREFGRPVRYSTHRELLESEKVDALLVCEEFGRRGEVILAALRAGKHVFSDKPLCTRLEELNCITALAAEKRLEVHADFCLCYYWTRAGELLRQGEIGEIVGCNFAGPHWLNYAWRPRWYYTPDKHGGIINDLLGHGVDFAHWITRRRYTEVLSATRACVGVPQHPTFETFGDASFRLEGGASAFGHVDYLSPTGHPAGWRCFVYGTKGDALVNERDGLCLRKAASPERRLKPEEIRADPRSSFTDFVGILTDGSPPLRTTAETLHCSLATLLAQQAAVTGQTHVPVPPFKETRC